MVRLDAALGVAHPQIQGGERPLQSLQRIRGARLGVVQTHADLRQQGGSGARPSRLLDRLDAIAQLADARALALVHLIETGGDGGQGRVQLVQSFARLGPGVLLQTTQATMALAQLFGDVVDAAGLDGFGFVLRLKTAHQTGHGLVDALDREGRAALGRLQTLGDHLQRSAHAAQVLMAAQAFMPVRILAIDVVQAARAAAAVIGVRNGRPARQGGDAVVVVRLIHDHGVQPLAQGHARTSRQILGDLARLGIDALHAPRRRCGH